MTYYFTFGQMHKHPETNEEMKDYYIQINAKDERDARKIMFSQYGNKWAFCYNANNFESKYCPKGCYETLRIIKKRHKTGD